jgi:hypothetical protein
LHAKIYIDHLNKKQNQSIVNYNLTLKNDGENALFDVNVFFYKDLGAKLTVRSKTFECLSFIFFSRYLNFQLKVKLFQVVGKTKRQIIALPDVNYCDVRRGMFGVMFVYKDLLEDLYKFGNLTSMCPLKKGYYNMKNILIKDNLFPPYVLRLGSGTYMVLLIVLDESSKTKLWVSTSEIYIVVSG